MRIARLLAVGLLAISVIAVAACNNDPLHVTAVQLGKSLNPDNSVGTHTTSFKPRDTVYLSVLTGASGSGTIETTWYYGSTKVNEMKKDVSYHGGAATEFRFHNTAGLPPGPYHVEVLLDGKSVDERTFKIE
jgi:hypothetical protein